MKAIELKKNNIGWMNRKSTGAAVVMWREATESLIQWHQDFVHYSSVITYASNINVCLENSTSSPTGMVDGLTQCLWSTYMWHKWSSIRLEHIWELRIRPLMDMKEYIRACPIPGMLCDLPSIIVFLFREWIIYLFFFIYWSFWNVL